MNATNDVKNNTILHEFGGTVERTLGAILRSILISGNSRVCLMIASDNTISTTHAELSPDTKTS